ncbi:Putative sarcosine oxidase, beta subunit [Nitratireductor indicus C115]|uniref:Putative sarcosine oxidase, beta subunit n=1 Tax=Nitratireductor indicus C115 TaxID=1231190 RepID=K2P633_9HYPH|nr:FAD-dependent oxidoreductase [Nitratireductor indicus]EKF42786.1 Putative sarcosine oxidase, beta subunit [Nitratireductor indicus C115]SFQ40194.1 sarcosine oxidase subunit beta [Nitratireductor indicus]
MAAGSSQDITTDLLVIGGGIHGCSAALNAALRGMRVVVFEKDTVARHASGVNAGGVRKLGRHVAEIPLSLHSMSIWNRIADFLDDDCGFQPAPQIKIAETEDELDTLRERVAELNGLGYTHEVILDRKTMRGYLPAVAEHCVGALASLQDGFAQPYQTTFAFQRKGIEKGVRFLENTPVDRVFKTGKDWKVVAGGQTFTGRFVLNCAGAWGGEIARQIGDHAPVSAYAPMMIVTERVRPFCDAVVGATGRPLSFKQMPNGTVVIGGGRPGIPDPATNRTHMQMAQLRHSAQTAIDIFPIMRGAQIVRSWAGIEGLMPDGIPVIGPALHAEGAFHSFGFSAHGFQLGPGVGDIVAELIATGRTQAPIAPFSVGRFSQVSTKPNEELS